MSLDSRVLTHLSCYAKRFPKPGRVRYRILAGSGACPPASDDESQFTIEVSGKAGKEAGQHDVQVGFTGGAFVTDPPHLEIRSGDVVLWHAADARVPGFTVRGQGPGVEVDSGALAEGAVYTYAFGEAGRYEWTDARGGPVSGVVDVVPPRRSGREDCEGWIKALSEGRLIHVASGKARPAQVQVVPGQTVIWAVEDEPGISVTDRRLVLEPAESVQAGAPEAG